jgi:hypothetical protein
MVPIKSEVRTPGELDVFSDTAFDAVSDDAVDFFNDFLVDEGALRLRVLDAVVVLVVVSNNLLVAVRLVLFCAFGEGVTGMAAPNVLSTSSSAVLAIERLLMGLTTTSRCDRRRIMIDFRVWGKRPFPQKDTACFGMRNKKHNQQRVAAWSINVQPLQKSGVAHGIGIILHQ